MGGDRETGKGKNKGKEENKEKKIRELKEEENKRGGKEEWEDIAKRRRISLEQWGGGSQQRTHTHTHTHTHTQFQIFPHFLGKIPTYVQYTGKGLPD